MIENYVEFRDVPKYMKDKLSFNYIIIFLLSKLDGNNIREIKKKNK